MICGKDLIIRFLDEKREDKDSIKITLSEEGIPGFDSKTQIGRDSIDLRIGSHGYKIKCNVNFINTLDENIGDYFEDITLKKDGYSIQPGETIVVSTVEKIKLNGNITGELVGRTRYARMGLSVSYATKFQSYSDAVIVLQICNHNRVPLKIFPYQKLVQLVIHKVDGIPNEVRGNYYNESTLRKPLITEDELSGFNDERKIAVKKQTPKKIKFRTVDGKVDNIKKNNRIMSIASKILGSLSAGIGVVIGILCSRQVDDIYIISLALSSVFSSVMSVFLDIIKENNYIDRGKLE